MSILHKFLTTGLVVSVVMLANTLPALASGEFEIHKNFVKFDGKRWFRKNAQEIELGSWGNKLTPVLGSNGLDPKGSFRALLKNNFKKEPPINTQGNSGHKVKVVGSLSDLTDIVGLSGNDVSELIRTNRCKFREVHVDSLERFKKELNHKELQRDKIKDNNSRVVTAVLVVQQCELTEEMRARHQGMLKAPIKGLMLEINSDAQLNSASEIELTKGSVLGYVLRKPEWDKKAERKRDKIEDLKLDTQGL